MTPKSRVKILCVSALLLGLAACKDGDPNDGFRAPPRVPVPLSPGDTYALTSGNRLITFNRATPGTARTSVNISGLGAGETLLGIDFRPANGVLYGVTSAGRIVTISPGTGAVTVGPALVAAAGDDNPFTALSGTNFGVDFNPVPDRLRVVGDTGQNLRINVDSGAVITDTNLTLGGAAAAGVTAAAYTNSFGAACRTALFYVNTTTNSLLTTSDPNAGTLTAVGSGLGVTASSGISALEIVTAANGSNSALAALSSGSGSTLYGIDTTTGTATMVGAIDTASETIRGLAIPSITTAPAQAVGELYGLTENNTLVTFNRGAPAKLCTSAAIAPLNAGENVVGIDFRPSTGALHALGNASGTGRLLTLDPATAAVTTAVGLSQPLVGSDFGVDFNPTGPVALRIVSDLGQNLRVTDIAAGTTVADGTLGGAGSTANSAAYTNSVQGAGTTTLYVVDATTDMLAIQNPPNNGTLTTVGALGIDVSGGSGFDIDGRDNVAFLAANLPGSAGTALYTLNLATGAASASLGTVGGGARLRGISRPTPVTTVFGLRGSELVSLSLSDPTAVTSIGTITGLGSETLVGIDVRPSTRVLYGVGSGGGLFTINPTTAAATRVALTTAPDIAATGFGVDFNPAPATVPLRIVSNTAQNLRVSDVAAGTVVVDTAQTRAADPFAISAVSYTNSFTPNPTSTVLYGLDATGDRLVAITPPNNGTVRVIGPTGFNVTGNASMEIIGPSTAVAVFDSVVNPPLYTINLATGAATFVGAINTSLGIQGLAAVPSTTDPVASSTIYAVGVNSPTISLLSFARNAPGTVTTIGTVTGVGAGESVDGIDFRPSDGLLYMLTTGGGSTRAYTVDTTTAAATLVGVLIADPTDATAPFTAVAGATRGINFNPMPAAVPLRIVSDSGQNLRVSNLATLTTFTDADINQPAPSVNAAAYSNSFPTPAGVTATTALYVIDAATGSLLQQGLTTPPGPNGGVLTNVGALTAADSFSALSGFDIGGGANGVALAALQKIVAGTPEASSRLYRVNIATGAASEVVAGALIGGAGAAPIGGLAIRIQ